MKNNNLISLCAFFIALLPLTPSLNAQTQQSSLNRTDGKLDSVVVINQYHDNNNGQSTITRETCSYALAAKQHEMLMSSVTKQQTLSDNFTSHTLSLTDRYGDVTRTSYNALGHPLSVDYYHPQQNYAYASQKTDYTWQQNRRQTLTTRIDGSEQRVIRDALGRVIQQASKDSVSDSDWRIDKTQQFTDLGQVSQVTNSYHVQIIYQYDALGRKIETDTPTYQGTVKQLVRFDDVANSSTAWQQNGKLRSAIQKQLRDTQGKVIAQQTVTPTAQLVDYLQQDNFSDQVAINAEREGDNDASLGSHAYSRQLASLRYDAQGNLVQKTLLAAANPAADLPSDAPVQVTLHRDLFSKITAKTLLDKATQQAKPVSSYQLRYDGQGRLLQRRRLADNADNDLVKRYAYDAQHNRVTISMWQQAKSIANAKAAYRITQTYQNIAGKQVLREIDVPAYQPPNGDKQAAFCLAYLREDKNNPRQITRAYRGQLQIDGQGNRHCDTPQNEVDFSYRHHQLYQKRYLADATTGQRAATFTYHYQWRNADGSLSDGRLLSVTQASGQIVAYNYHLQDANGKAVVPQIYQTRWQSPEQTPIARLNIDYDQLTRPYQWQRYRYDQQGHVIPVDSQQQIRDAYGHVVQQRWLNGEDNRIVLANYRYYGNGKIAEQSYSSTADAGSQVKRFHYDNVNRLVQSDVISKTMDGAKSTEDKQNYYYTPSGDAKGQIEMTQQNLQRSSKLSPQSVFNGLHQLLSTYSDRQIKFFHYDKNNGNRLDDANGRYEYNGLGQLIRYTNKTTGLTTSYQFNALGERIGKSRLGGNHLAYYYERGLLASSQDKQGNQATYFYHGKHVEGRLVQQGKERQTLSFYRQNNHGSTSEVLSYGVAGHALHTTYRYSDYGQVSRSGAKQPTASDDLSLAYRSLLYSGGFTEQESGGRLQHLGKREFDTKTHLFTALDSKTFINPYLYCDGEPNDYTDLTGEAPYNNTGVTILGCLNAAASCFNTWQVGRFCWETGFGLRSKLSCLILLGTIVPTMMGVSMNFTNYAKPHKLEVWFNIVFGSICNIILINDMVIREVNRRRLDWERFVMEANPLPEEVELLNRTFATAVREARVVEKGEDYVTEWERRVAARETKLDNLSEEVLSNLEDEIGTCPLSHEILSDPVKIGEGKTVYNRQSLIDAKARGVQFDPMPPSETPLTAENVRDANDIADEIDSKLKL